jgi:hypothetical protein
MRKFETVILTSMAVLIWSSHSQSYAMEDYQPEYQFLNRKQAMELLLGNSFVIGQPGFPRGYRFISNRNAEIWMYGGTVSAYPRKTLWSITKRGLICVPPNSSISSCFRLIQVNKIILFREYDIRFDKLGNSRVVFFDKAINFISKPKL